MPTIDEKALVQNVATLVNEFCDEHFTRLTPSVVANGLMFVATRMARIHMQQHRPDLSEAELSRRAEDLFGAMQDAVLKHLHHAGTPVGSLKNGSSKHRN